MVVTVRFYQGLFLPDLSQLGLVWVLVPWGLTHGLRAWGSYGQRLRQFLQISITMGLVVSWIGAIALLQHSQVVPEEAVLWRRLTGQSLPQVAAVVQWSDQQKAQRQMAEWISRSYRPGERILMDDRSNFPILYFVHNAKPFVLPYQEMFAMALQQPQDLVDYVLVAQPQMFMPQGDRILEFWPHLADRTSMMHTGPLQSFSDSLSSPNYRLLKRIQ